MACAAIAVGGSTPAGSNHKLTYLEGLRAVDAKRWRDAVVLFAQAIEDEPTSGGLVRPYGTWFEPYVPYFYLGLALFEVGRYGRALEAWSDSEAQGVINFPRSRHKRRQMVDRRTQIGARLKDKLASLEAELQRLEAARERLAEGSRAVFRDGGLPSAPLAASDVVELLSTAARQAESGEISAAAATLHNAEEALNDIWAETAAGVEEAERLKRTEVERGLVAIRRQADAVLNSRIEKAAALVDRGLCSEEAVEILDAVVLESFEPSEVSRQASRAISLLAFAHDLCDRPALADIYRDLLTDEAAASRSRGDKERTETRFTEAGPLGALEAYLTAMAWIDLGVCSDLPLALLDTARSVLAEVPTSTLRGTTFRPHLAEALAHRNCWNLKAVRSSLDKAIEVERLEEPLVEELEHWMAEVPFANLYSGSYALVAAASRYGPETGWSNLPGAAEDAAAVRSALERHGFQVDVLADPTTTGLEKALKLFLTRYGRRPENRLIFYYAGHGWTEEAHDIKNGYIVPVDTPHPELRGNEAFLHLISMGTFEGYARSMLARHALFVFDTCFGGTIFEATRATVESAAGTDRLRELLDQKVRMFLTAGDETQRVPDFSVFRRSLVTGLGGAADGNHDGVVLGHELGSYVRTRVSEDSSTTPLWGRMLAGTLGKGDIAFFGGSAGDSESRQTSTVGGRAELRFDLEIWSRVRARGSRDAYRAYRELRPRGRFTELARWLEESMSHES